RTALGASACAPPNDQPQVVKVELRHSFQDLRRRAPLKVNRTIKAGSTQLTPPRLFQINSHFRLGAMETKSWCGTGTERSLGSTILKGTNGCARKAPSMASILTYEKLPPRRLSCQ